MKFSLRVALTLGALLLPVLAGCGRHSQTAPGAPLRVIPRIRIQRANTGAVSPAVDSLSAEALDGDGNVIAGPAPLVITGGNFRGELEVPTGIDRRIRVRAFVRKEQVYQGLSNLLAVGVNGTDSVDILLRPAVSLALVPGVSAYVVPDSLVVDLVDTSQTVSSNIALNFSADIRIFSFARVVPGPDLPSDGSVDLSFPSLQAARPTGTARRLGTRGAKSLDGQLFIQGGAAGIGRGVKRIARLTFYSYPALDSVQVGVDTTRIRITSATSYTPGEQSLPILTTDALVRLSQNGPPRAVPVISRFDGSNEGWSAVGDPASPFPLFHSTGGNPGGYVSDIDNQQNIYWYYRAPAKFRGNMAAAYGRVLKFDQKETPASNVGTYDVILRGAGHVLLHDGVDWPDTSWTSLRVPLIETASWIDSATSVAPSSAVFLSTLSSLTSLDILGEWVNGADTGSLDNVVFGDTIGPASPGQSCITAIVTRDGQPVLGAQIHVGGHSGETAADGSFCFSADANSAYQVSAQTTINNVLYLATGSVTTGAPAVCGGNCARVNLALVAQQQTAKRYSVEAFAYPNLAQQSGEVGVIVTDDSLSANDTSAIITVQRDTETPVQLKHIANGVYFASAISGSGLPVIALDPGHLYTIRADVEGDGQVDAQSALRMVPSVTILRPAAQSVQPSTFNMTWQPDVVVDSLFHYASVNYDSSNRVQYRYGFNTTSAQFDTLTPGACQAQVLTVTGSFILNPVFGLGFQYNLVGPKVTGYWYSAHSTDPVQFSVGSPHPVRRQSMKRSNPLEKLMPPRILERLRKARVLAHTR